MLNYCDIYPIVLPARYANKYACYNTVYIVSNWLLEEQYSDIQITQRTSWEAFLRRIKKVIVFRKNGEKDVYDSTAAYFRRMEKVEAGMEIPFEEEGNDRDA